MCSSDKQPQNGVTTSRNSASAGSRNNANSGNSSTSPNSSPQQVKQLGMTSAISLAGPRPEDLQKSEELRKALELYNVFESKDELNHRLEILAKLNTLVKQWVKDISIAKSMPEASAQKLGGKIYTFGSYRLGVHQKGADIDALCVVPRNIERSDYFTSFFEVLKKQPEITECRAIEEAFVPVMKMKFDGFEIDLLFARLSLKEIPDDLDLRDDNLLKNLDPRSVRSLNGYRVTDEILSLVPNLENFRLALRLIKLWAKKHGIYSNSLGYFGGVAWAMLVARTCQLYPNATASTLVHKFFLVFSRWNWPRPVLLKQPANVDLGFPVWDPRINALDRYHLMPIITPVYPQQNSTFNVSESTKKVIMMELNRGMATMDEIMFGRASWDKLFEAPSFFCRYRHFIALLVNSQTADDHLEWSGLVESKIRFLIADLERHQHISLVHLNPKCFDYKKGNDNNNNNNSSPQNNSGNEKDKSQSNVGGFTQTSTFPFCSMWFIGLEFERAEKLNVDLTENIQNFADCVRQRGAHINMLKEGMSIDARYVKRKQLSQYLDADFLKRERKSMTSHNSFNNATMENRKRLSSEMLSKDNSNGNTKKPRVSESNKENSNVSSDAGGTTTPITPASAQQAATTAAATAAPSATGTVDNLSDNNNSGGGGGSKAASPQPATEVVCSRPLPSPMTTSTAVLCPPLQVLDNNIQTFRKNNNTGATTNSNGICSQRLTSSSAPASTLPSSVASPASANHPSALYNRHARRLPTPHTNHHHNTSSNNNNNNHVYHHHHRRHFNAENMSSGNNSNINSNHNNSRNYNSRTLGGHDHVDELLTTETTASSTAIATHKLLSKFHSNRPFFS